MKNLNHFLRAALLLFTLLAFQTGMAYDVEIDGIYYNLTSHTTASVTHYNNSLYEQKYYSGSITVPSSITYDGNEHIVTAIDNSAFSGSSELTNVDLPNSITIIKDGAFSGCRNLLSIQIPNSVTSIGDYAFGGCSGLTSMTIPNSVTTIGDRAFVNSGLTNIYISDSVTSIGSDTCDGTPWFENQSEGVVYLGPYVYSYKGTMPENTSITIKPGTKGIVDWAFYDCAGLTNIKFPESLRVIGKFAFEDCKNLTEIEVPNSLQIIGYDPFSDTKWYRNQPDGFVYVGKVLYHYKGTIADNTELLIPEDVINIADGAFSIYEYYDDELGRLVADNYDGLISLIIPNNVRYIGESAFGAYEIDFENLKTVFIGNGVEEVRPMAFAGNVNLTDVTISEGVKVIGDQMFAGCSSLREVTIPNSVEEIRYRAFSVFDDNWLDKPACISLTTVTIGSGVKKIEKYAFSGCKALTDITCLATTPPTLEDVNCFDEDNYTEAILYVPKGSELSYMKAYGWKKFIHIVGITVEVGPGDVNGDGEINIGDINNLVNAILENEFSEAYDVNGDGEIGIADINEIIQLILSAN